MLNRPYFLPRRSCLLYTSDIYRTVVKHEMMENSITGFDLHEYFYIIRDNSIFAVKNILALYDHIIMRNEGSPLYEKLVTLHEEQAVSLIEETVETMKEDVYKRQVLCVAA